jgi:pimeloyl-ACP methyl ester carboxylesterase
MTDIHLNHIEIQTNRLRLHAVQAGPDDGDLAVLLHGFPEFWYGWRYQIDALASAGFHVLAPDQRGYNLSDKPREVSAYRLEETGKDVLALLDELGRDKATIIGHDWGGGTGWWLAAHHPERVQGLVIVNMPHPVVIRRTLLRSPRQVLRSLYAAFFQIPRLPEALLRNNDWELLVRNLQESSRPGTFSAEDIEQYRRAWWQEGAMTGMLNWYRANLRYPPDFPDKKIAVRTLIIWGAQDPVVGREMAAESAAMCAEPRLVLFEDATHWVQHEKAGEVSRLVVEFMKQWLIAAECGDNRGRRLGMGHG